MKKDYLLQLKKILMSATMIAGVSLLSGCAGETVSEESGSTSVESDAKEYEKDTNVEKHQHVIVEMGNMTYIIRECDDTISDIRVIEHDGFIGLDVYNADDEQVIKSYIYGKSQVYVIDSQIKEESINEIEDKAIENGAIVYKALTR